MNNKLLWAAALSGFLITTGAWAQAPEVLNPPVKTEAKKKAKKPKTQSGKKGSKAKFIPGSQETKKERSARLTRECKGAVNAGACTGYTQ
ncbi:MAG: hypothetical protein WBK51_10600 [Polaromonas sp.]